MYVTSMGITLHVAVVLTKPVSVLAVWSHLCRLLAAKASLQGMLSLQVQGSSVQRSRTAGVGPQKRCQARDL